MIDDGRRDEAVDFVMGMLDPLEAERFRAAMRQDSGLEAEVTEIENASAKLAYAAPLHRPPPELKQRIMAEITGTSATAAARSKGTWIPWAIAAALAVAAVFLFGETTDRTRQIASLQQENALANEEQKEIGQRLAELEAERAREVAGIRRELASLKERDAMATMKIATLKAQVSAYEKAFAVVVWDAKAQTGLVKLNQFPAAAEGKDYQLWLIDPNKPAPVSGGLVQVAPDGVAQVEFTPKQPMPGAETFAISVEPKGGSEAPQGDIVVLGK